ncbi:Uncharacterised protein [Staphylococcus aureus]|nr:Uncharacterised protein [Staphylococcus aureus]
MWYDSVVERIPSVPSINAVLQMRQITAVIAPEHNRIHHDHKNKLKNDEELLMSKEHLHFIIFSDLLNFYIINYFLIFQNSDKFVKYITNPFIYLEIHVILVL